MKKNVINQLFCKHRYETVTNLYGYWIDFYKGSKSIQECTKCGKRIYNSCTDPECRNVNKI